MVVYSYDCKTPERLLTDPGLIDRESECRELAALLNEGAPRLALLYGRRRVGKTFLLTHVWPTDRTFYFTASATTAEQNRRQLLDELAAWSGTNIAPEDYPTWRSVFRLILELRTPSPLVVVLDEFQYLGDDAGQLGSVASELNAVWEQRRAPRALVLALSGSAVRTLEALDAGGAPLHGRFAWKARLDPFDYFDAAALTRFRSLRDRARAYAIFGGTPRYLSVVRPGLSIAENAARLALAPRGEVRGMVETVLVQEQGLRDVSKYQAILRAIGSGATEMNEIAQRAGLPTDTALRDKVERLIELGYVRARRNIGAARTAAYRYAIADPALAFHAEFVAPFESALERHDAHELWRERIAPVFDTYMGRLFEVIVEQAYRRLQPRLGLPLIREWGRWEGQDRDGQPLELDVVAPLATRGVLTGAVKWNARPVGAAVHHDHMRMLERLAALGVRWAHQAGEVSSPLLYVAAGGFTDDFKAAARASGHPVYLWSLADLYHRAGRKRPRPGTRGSMTHQS